MLKHFDLRTKRNKKLSRAEIVETLEQNSQLYREEEAFVSYLAELTLYLLQYRYDGADEGELPDGKDDKPEPATEARSHGSILSSDLNYSNASANQRSCPFCGRQVGESRLCHACGHMTR